ncbi:MAG TPA: hypothetical protein VHJ69_06740 [Gemmatimonadales bacterium]|nr:hypothetical protein [Gemmatimonadales bacterium]
MQNLAPPRRRYPRARADLRFLSTGGRLALGAADRPCRPVDFVDALVLTYCDGRHDTGAIAAAVAGSLREGRSPDSAEGEVRRILQELQQEGFLV